MFGEDFVFTCHDRTIVSVEKRSFNPPLPAPVQKLIFFFYTFIRKNTICYKDYNKHMSEWEQYTRHDSLSWVATLLRNTRTKNNLDELEMIFDSFPYPTTDRFRSFWKIYRTAGNELIFFIILIVSYRARARGQSVILLFVLIDGLFFFKIFFFINP